MLVMSVAGDLSAVCAPLALQIKSLEHSMGAATAGSHTAEEGVKVLRFVMGGLQIPFIFFMLPGAEVAADA